MCGCKTGTVSSCWRSARRRRPEMPVILITGYGSVDTAVDALRAGAFDFLTKPLIDDELALAVRRCLNQREVIEENRNLKAQLDMRYGLENIVGRDHRMVRIFDVIEAGGKRLTNAYTECQNGLTRAIDRLGRGYSFETLRVKLLWRQRSRASSPPIAPSGVRRQLKRWTGVHDVLDVTGRRVRGSLRNRPRSGTEAGDLGRGHRQARWLAGRTGVGTGEAAGDRLGVMLKRLNGKSHPHGPKNRR